MTELHALRDAYRSDKAALLAAMQSTGASTRGIRVLLRKLSSLAGNLLQTLWQPTDIQWAATLGLMVLGGWWAAEVTALHMGIADPGHIVIDEIVAIWLVLWLAMPMGFWGQAAAFALFRFFDAAKPQPVRWADRLFKGFGARGAWGIMFDDLVAAFCTLLVIAVWRF